MNTVSTARAVESSAYVELRALEVAKGEVAAESSGAEKTGGTSWVKRFWPFRWPTQMSNMGPTQPQPIPGSSPGGSGQYIDILI